jgi:preprotein translocase subunit YajC
MSHVHALASSSIHGVLPLVGSLLAATTTKKSGNSSITLIFFVLLFGVGYVFLIRPRNQRRQRQQQVSKQIAVGDTVMLTSGIIGRVEGFVGDRAKIEIAPGMTIEVVRQAVAQRVDPDADANANADHDGSYDDDDHEDLVDDSDHDPYAVPPLEASHTSDSGDEEDGGRAGGNGSGGGST